MCLLFTLWRMNKYQSILFTIQHCLSCIEAAHAITFMNGFIMPMINCIQLSILRRTTLSNTVMCYSRHTLHDFLSIRKLDVFIRALLLARSHSCADKTNHHRTYILICLIITIYILFINAYYISWFASFYIDLLSYDN